MTPLRSRANRRLLEAAMVGGLLLPLSGCPSLLTVGPARTVPRGQTEELVVAGAYRATLVTGEPPAPVERSREWIPFVEAGARIGLGENADLSFRAGTGGGSIGPRLQLARSASEDTGLDAMLEPSFGWTGFFPGDRGGVVSGLTLSVGIPLGWNLGGGAQLVLSPRVAMVIDRVVGSDTLAGGSLGLVLPLATTVRGRWSLVPECALAASKRTGDAVAQCGLGLLVPR